MDSCWRNTTLLLLSLLFMFYSFSHAANNITRGQSIRDGETIVSDNGDFALGFFTPGNSTFRYVGIWYAKLPRQTVVWVANRENPITNSSGSITVASDGNLQVLDGSGRGVWSTNAPNNSSNLLAIIMKNGNLLLCGEEVGNPEKALWQSFEDPTDTFLPGMRAGLNTRIGETRLYSSWKSESDPSKGNFTMGVDPNGLAQIVIWKNSERHWRSGIWNNQVFIGVPNMRVIYLYGFKLSDHGGRTYFTYTALNSSDFLRFRLRWDGVEEQRRWDAGRNEWNTFWSQPTNVCQTYNHCGAYANCNSVGSPICTCLQGFVPRSQSEWDRGNWSKGCKRRADLQCERKDTGTGTGTGKEDRFLALNGVKLPDNSALRRVENENQCKAECSRNCSCRAYAYASVGFGCLTWTQDLVDIQQFHDIQQSDAMDNRLYIRLAHSEIGSKKKSVLTLVLVLSLVLGTIFVSIFAFLIWRCKRKSRIPKFLRKNQAVVLDGNQSRDMWMNFNEQHDIGEANEGSMPELPLLSFESIAATTNNFSEEFKLGQGGFGPVYKGNMPCGLEVAIKRLSRKSGQGIEEFKNEVILIAKLQHRNLVRLLGCCIQGEERILVYEYMSNKSLDAFIFNSTTGVQLNWKQRFDIIEGIARGLLYLHRDSRLRIIHRDLKASNILLDGEMIPKISDFGMAKIFGGNENQENTNRVVGTYGYMAPEYAMEGLFSVKSDVYSFGVLLLEIISGKKCTQFRDPDHGLNLLGYVWKLWNEQKAMEFIDPSIRETCSEAEVLRCIQVGLLCVQDSAIDRPIMSSVVLMLGSESTVLPKARQPMFTIGRSPLEMDVSIDSSETMSRNNVTVTMLVGR